MVQKDLSAYPTYLLPVYPPIGLSAELYIPLDMTATLDEQTDMSTGKDKRPDIKG